MRIPHVINQNTLTNYEPSQESSKLFRESDRHIFAEDLDTWDRYHCHSLAEWCVKAISDNFAKKPLLDELPCQDRNYLLEILSTDLDLEIVVPLIKEEIYWQRRYKDKFGLVMRKKLKNWTWKILYIQRHVEEMVEQAEPQYNDEEDMSEILKLCAPYITQFFITQLQMWIVPLTWEKEDIPEIFPIDHINFTPILSKLVNIEELDVIYGMNDVGDKFDWRMFKVSVTDIKRLGQAALKLKDLKMFRLHRCKIEDMHCQTLIHSLIKNQTLVELDLSNCFIGDLGALCIAKFLMVHPTLETLNLANNKIGPEGAEGLGYALQEAALTLKTLNIKLNPLGHDGGVAVMTGALLGERLEKLVISGCEFEEATSVRMCNMIQVNKTLKSLDVSNNWFDESGGEELISALKVNKTLCWLNVRETDITKEQQNKVNRLLMRNRSGGLEDTRNEIEEEREEHEKETEDGFKESKAETIELDDQIVDDSVN